jgi:hypothetical protein
MNAKFRATMEDAFTIIDGFGSDPGTGYFGVYDGHGGAFARTLSMFATLACAVWRQVLRRAAPLRVACAPAPRLLDALAAPLALTLSMVVAVCRQGGTSQSTCVGSCTTTWRRCCARLATGASRSVCAPRFS